MRGGKQLPDLPSSYVDYRPGQQYGMPPLFRRGRDRRDLFPGHSPWSTGILLLLVAILASSLVAMVIGWVTWAIEHSVGKALIAGGTAFGGTLALLITAFNFVMKREA
ncbi:hypothetical protein ACLQ29_04625 [Micromonospora sp. DT228]|uniref:hypothetical protein n=1 Tax=Micromonospora sp. DT228 TaxID=3393443 RepID=UPI003CF59166